MAFKTSILYASVQTAVLLLLILVWLPFSSNRRALWLVLATTYFFFYDLMLILPLQVPEMKAGSWNWTGKTLGILFSLCWLQVIKFSRSESGLQWPQNRRAWIFGLAGLLGMVLLSSAECLLRSPQPYTIQHVIFEATMPGIDEELAFRGILFALLLRGFAANGSALRALLPPAITVTVLFWMVHAISLQHGRIVYDLNKPEVLLAGVLFLLLRVGSGSTLVCAAAHNLDNMANVLIGSLW